MVKKFASENQRNKLNKLDVMDSLLGTFHNKINSLEICQIVNQTFGFDLGTIPVLDDVDTTSRVAIDLYLNKMNGEISGSEISDMTNKLFGINLEAISRLEGRGISLYSKGLWVVQTKNDLFVVYTGLGDVDVKIYPTNWYKEQTGLESLPNELALLLTNLGYYYDSKVDGYYYSNPNSEAVSDDFKGQTMQAIMQVIHNSYSHLLKQ